MGQDEGVYSNVSKSVQSWVHRSRMAKEKVMLATVEMARPHTLLSTGPNPEQGDLVQGLLPFDLQPAN
jgi:hypothetical protein